MTGGWFRLGGVECRARSDRMPNAFVAGTESRSLLRRRRLPHMHDVDVPLPPHSEVMPGSTLKLAAARLRAEPVFTAVKGGGGLIMSAAHRHAAHGIAAGETFRRWRRCPPLGQFAHQAEFVQQQPGYEELLPNALAPLASEFATAVTISQQREG